MSIVLDHIGIAVANLPELRKLFSLLGLEVKHSEHVEDQKVQTHFLPLPVEPSNLEFLEPTDEEGPIAKFLKKRGPGIHHLSFRVQSGELDGLCDKLRQEGYRLTYEAPRQGAHSMRINFIHPASAGGLLIELMEPSRHS